MTSLLKEVETLISETTAYINPVEIQYSDKITEYMNIDANTLYNMSRSEVLVLKFELEKYLAYLSDNIIMAQTKLEINKTIFYRLIASKRKFYKEEKLSDDLLIAQICVDRIEAKNMHDEIIKLESVVNKINAPVPHIKSMIETLKSLSYERR